MNDVTGVDGDPESESGIGISDRMGRRVGVRGLESDGFKGIGFPERLLAFGGEFIEGIHLGFAEEESACRGGFFSPIGFNLAGEHGFFVSMTQHVGDDGFYILGLIATLGESASADGVGVNHLEKEGAGVFFLRLLFPTAAEGGERTSNKSTDDFID